MPKPLTQKEVLSKLARGEPVAFLEIGDVDFSGFAFKKRLKFSQAVFTGKVGFQEAQFLNGADFNGTKFSGESGVSFFKTKFFGKEGTNFLGTEFSGNGGARFGSAQFSGNRGVHFREAIFSGEGKASFRGTEFSGEGETSFMGTEFSCSEGADFFLAKFTGPGGANFIGTKFSGKSFLSLFNAQFLGPGKIRFKNTFFAEDKTINFSHIEIGSPGVLEFVDSLWLGNVLFLYTDLEKISFKNVRFHQTRDWFFSRECLADEIATYDGTKEKYDQRYYTQVEILYRKLKENFETQRDYARAGDFHYGEMEMKRKGQMLVWEERPLSKYLPFLKYLTLTQCYKIVSGYGEKWQQALASFLVVWMVFSGLNLSLIQPVQQQSTQVEQWQKSSLHKLSGSALFSFKVLTLQRWDREFQLKGTSYLPGLFISLQHLIGPTLIALMLLAIRRQFRR